MTARALLTDHFRDENSTQQVQVAVGQERFCREIAAGHTYEDSYRRAYGLHAKAACLAEASRLARLPHIVARTMQLRTASIKGYVVEREMLLENLMWAVNTARERGSTTEVRKCIEAIGKLFGLIIDKVEANIMGQFQVMKEVSIDGSNLMFDVGGGSPVIIKGERAEVLQNMQENEEPALTSPQDAIKTVANVDGIDTLDALQNAAKTLPMQPVHLDDVPLEAVLDVPAVNGVHDAATPTAPRRLQRADSEALTDEEALLLGEIA